MLDKKFDELIRSIVVSSVRGARRRITEDIFDDEEDADVAADNPDDTDADEETDTDPDNDSESIEQSETPSDPAGSTRGGQQQARAATRELPAPDEEDLNYNMIAQKINAIRSGRSLSDKDTAADLKKYLGTLSSTQRLALFAFVEGLAEVIAANVDGDKARRPDDPDYGMAITKTTSSETEAVDDEQSYRRIARDTSTSKFPVLVKQR